MLAKDEQAALDALCAVLPIVRESWEPETTARNIKLIQEARAARGETLAWIKDILPKLEKKSRV